MVSVERSLCKGSLFLISRPFLQTPFASLEHFFALADHMNRPVLDSYLCQLVYSTSLHNIRDGIAPQACKELADHLNRKPISIEGAIEALEIVSYKGNKVTTIERVTLL